ncbi:MAG: peptidoglycan endopeptidase [Sphingomonas sp.]|nr:peptidoglycan endopeptidase [Sphingomonas sp.]
MIDAERAVALVGRPFRAQGRDAGAGLDCVGLVLAACGLSPDRVRRNYRLRGDHGAELVATLTRDFRRVAPSRKRIGDLILMIAGEGQFHLGILTARGFVHADARLRRVVETPGRPRWRVCAIYRRRRK